MDPELHVSIQVATIGFTQKTAEQFFQLLRRSGTQRLIDVRLNNQSQLSGFAKRADLAYFLRELCHIDYDHIPEFTPTKPLLEAFKKNKGDWSVYSSEYLALMERRQVEKRFTPEELDGCCFLCSEHLPHHCHRRLLVEYLNGKWGSQLEVRHLT